jgi:hypothetical protein
MFVTGCGGLASSDARDGRDSAVDVVTQTEAGDDAGQSGYCADADVQLIRASSYDQSCNADTDCVSVSEGNACETGFLDCPNATIGKGGLSQYQSDIAKVRSASSNTVASCFPYGVPCCRSGTCRNSTDCDSSSDTLPACADAGGACGRIAGCGHNGAGPADSCAYTDEICCLR